MEAVAALFKLQELGGVALVAILIVVLNVLFHTFKEWFNRYYTERSQNRLAVDQDLRPLLQATSDLVSRLIELILQRGSRLQQAPWKPLAEKDRLPPVELDRFHSTVVRFIAFLALRETFRARTMRLHAPRLDKARFYLDRKIPAALKGNIFGAELLSGEDAEVIGEYFAPTSDTPTITPLTILNNMRTARGRTLFNHMGSRLSISIDALRGIFTDDHIANTSDTKRILTLVHLTIMLLDFFQDVSGSAQWEEDRMVLCKLIAKHNLSRDKKTFLYKHDDLSGADYLTSFSPHAVPAGTLRFDWAQRRGLRRTLQSRARRGIASHAEKAVTSTRIRASQGKKTLDLQWSDTAETMEEKLTTFLTSTRSLVSLSAQHVASRGDAQAAGTTGPVQQCNAADAAARRG